MIDPDAALTFLSFVEERHRAYLTRQAGAPQPWSNDPIVSTHKFTNVYRLLDYGSQFVLTDLIDEQLDPADQLARLFLYRHTGRVEAWQYLFLQLGDYPTRANLDDVLDCWREYRGAGVTKPKGRNVKGGFQSTSFERPTFTGAYLVFPQSQERGTDKLESIVDLTRRLFVDGRVADSFLWANNQQARFAALRDNKGVADFMSMQILTDWGYTTEFRENDFVVAGPGAVRGAKALDPVGAPIGTVRWAHREISFLRLGDRAPSLMDAQNTLCEFSKYLRFTEKPLPRKQYQPAHPGPRPDPVLPKHW